MMAEEASPEADYLTEVLRLLWPDPASAILVKRRPRPGGSAAGRAGSELIVLPGLTRPKLIVPAGRQPGAAALRRYGEPGSAWTKMAARSLAVMLASGLGSRVGDRLAVSLPDGAQTVASYLATALGTPLQIGMHIGAARANRKPVLQLLTPAGETVGFAKIGINPLTADLVRNEYAALMRLGETALADSGLTEPGPASLRIPSVLSFSRWNGLEVLILSALPVWSRRTRLPAGRLAAAMVGLARSAGTSAETFAASGYLRRLNGRLERAGEGATQRALSRLIARLADAAGSTSLTFGCWHGDLTPWNLASTRAGLLVWDWERFASGVPLGFDALHYWLQARVVRPAADPTLAAIRCAASAARLLEPFDVGPTQASLTALAYLAELSVRYLVDRQAHAGARLGAPGRWLIPAIEFGIGQL